MRNTGILYSSTERKPVVLPELAELLPPLSGEQLAALEADLLRNGCYSPIIVNEDLAIVDGTTASGCARNTVCPTRWRCSPLRICWRQSNGL